MAFETLTLSTDARGVATLTLARPDKHNAMSARMMAELSTVASDLAHNDAVRVVVLAADGPTFCAGGDLAWMAEQMNADRDQRMREARTLADMLSALDHLNTPIIARVHGNAFGGGLGLMAVCDAALADERARFSLSETRLGLIPATIAPYVINRMSAARARSVFMSGRMFDAREAITLGLVTEAVATADLDARVEAHVAPYLEAAPAAVAEAKRLLRDLAPPVDRAAIDLTVARLADIWETDAARQRVSAFLAKRAR